MHSPHPIPGRPRSAVWWLGLVFAAAIARGGDPPPVPSASPAPEPADWVPPIYEIHRAGGKLTIDGKLDEPAWFAAPSCGPFHFTWYRQGKQEQSVAKLLWDDEYLYVAHVCEDAHIAGRHREHDGPIPEDDCFEVIFAPNPEHPEVYFNVEWNVVGGYIDNFRPEGP
ncbi:MAG: carbohydrate-binding family 9-like protein, partial [Planctomycetaceae bacterium]